MIGRGPGSPVGTALLLALVAVCGFTGCSTYGVSVDPVLGPLSKGDPQAALDHLDQKPREGDALYQLERGLILRLAGSLQESNRAFDVANGIAEDLYTVSVSREAAALAVTDRLRPYRPPTHELLLTRHYQARNYLDEGDLEGAAVEARRIGLLSSQIADGSIDPPAEGDLLGRLTAALILEAASEPDNALALYRTLLRDAKDPETGLHLPLPAWVSGRAARLGKEVGVDLSAELPSEALSAEPAEGRGFTAIVFLESGFAPRRTEERIRVPILKTEEGMEEESIGGVAGERILMVRGGHWDDPDPDHIAYWLEVALPAYRPEPDSPIGFEVSSGPHRAVGLPATDIALCARSALDREMPAIVLRAALRAATKYGVHHQAEEKGGWFLGWVVNLLGVATEQADTRTWLALPRRIDMAVMDLPSPIDSVRVTVYDPSGGEESVELPILRRPGEAFGFGSYRRFD